MSAPLLVYDGDCGYCRYWVRYWQRLTGERVRYAPYQEVANEYPQVAPDEFRRSIWLFETDGRAARGADAAFRVLARAPGGGGWQWCYRHVPGVAAIAEAAYAVVARHRVAAARIARLLWGAERYPATHARVAGLFLRGLGLVYLAAFASLGLQIAGLAGADGILPLSHWLDALRTHYGWRAILHAPMVFWIASGDAALAWACWAGAAAGALIAAGRGGRVALVVAWALYLSLFYAGQAFMTFQWDLLLLEAGFLAPFLHRRAGTPVIWLYRWLLFRFMFLSGWVKVASGDAAWRSLTALDFHFETQPLPTALAWHAHHLPDALLRTATGTTLAIELLLPWLVFAPRRPRLLAAGAFVLFEGLIVATGNYNYFNLLTMLLCVPLLDDRALAALTPARWRPAPEATAIAHAARRPWGALAAAVLVLPASLVATGEAIARARAPQALHALVSLTAPLRLANVYGVFAVMTTARNEISIEGSDDGWHWREYRFRWKPDDPARRPGWNAPHQPRLDWQMWFAALGDEASNPWFGHLLERLLLGSPAVLALLGSNPFPDAPPRYVRASFWHYRYTTPAERADTGAWWVRTLEGSYYPPVGLVGATGAPVR